MITENLSTLKINKLTQAQYEREIEAGRIDETALYLTPDDETVISSGVTSVSGYNADVDWHYTIYKDKTVVLGDIFFHTTSDEDGSVGNVFILPFDENWCDHAHVFNSSHPVGIIPDEAFIEAYVGWHEFSDYGNKPVVFLFVENLGVLPLNYRMMVYIVGFHNPAIYDTEVQE